GAMLFLPERVEFDAPLIPPIGKEGVGALCAMAGAFLWAGDSVLRAKIGRGTDILIVVLVIASAMTAFTNPETLVNGPILRPGLTTYDGLSLAIREVLLVGIPFFLGRALFKSSKDLSTLMIAIANLGLVYSLLELVEIRLSPQFHRWLYGYHAHDFSQT